MKPVRYSVRRITPHRAPSPLFLGGVKGLGRLLSITGVRGQGQVGVPTGARTYMDLGLSSALLRRYL